jgi:hypothetical protein
LQVAQQAGRLVTNTARSDIVRANVDMVISKTILIESGTEDRWSNPSNLPNNVVGVFNQTTGSDSTESTGIISENSSSASNSNKTNTKSAEVIAIGSGFIGPNGSWQYRFDGEGFLIICVQFMQRKV